MSLYHSHFSSLSLSFLCRQFFNRQATFPSTFHSTLHFVDKYISNIDIQYHTIHSHQFQSTSFLGSTQLHLLFEYYLIFRLFFFAFNLLSDFCRLQSFFVYQPHSAHNSHNFSCFFSSICFIEINGKTLHISDEK